MSAYRSTALPSRVTSSQSGSSQEHQSRRRYPSLIIFSTSLVPPLVPHFFSDKSRLVKGSSSFASRADGHTTPSTQHQAPRGHRVIIPTTARSIHRALLSITSHHFGPARTRHRRRCPPSSLAPFSCSGLSLVSHITSSGTTLHPTLDPPHPPAAYLPAPWASSHSAPRSTGQRPSRSRSTSATMASRSSSTPGAGGRTGRARACSGVMR